MSDRLWERFLAALEGRLPPQALDTWIRPGRLLAHRDTHLEIGVPSQFLRSYIVDHYLPDLQAAAESCLGPRAHVTVSLDRAAASAPGAPPAAPAPPLPAAELDGRVRREEVAGSGLGAGPANRLPERLLARRDLRGI